MESIIKALPLKHFYPLAKELKITNLKKKKRKQIIDEIIRHDGYDKFLLF